MRTSTPQQSIFAVLAGLAILAFAPQRAQSGVTEAWVHRYTNRVRNADDIAYKVVIDAVGDIIVTGTTSNDASGRDILTIKYSGTDGAVRWQQRYNGPANLDDGPNAMTVDRNGNVVVTGYSQNGPYGFIEFQSDQDYYTAKYAGADGALLWEKRYNGPGDYYDSATAVAVDGAGNVVVTGTSQNAMTTDEFGDVHRNVGYYTAKYTAADGVLLWEKRHNGVGNGNDEARAVAVDASGNVVVTGSSWNGSKTEYYTAKYAAADGALLWEQQSSGPANFGGSASAVAVDAGGNVVVTGSSYNSTDADYYTAKYAAADGSLLWDKVYHGGSNDVASAVAVDAGGNVVVTGSSATLKYAAADGKLLWQKPSHGADQAVAVDAGGNVAVIGSSVTLKYAAADGALLWQISNDAASAVAVDAGGNVVVTGYGSNGTNRDFYTAKYSAANGALLWDKAYDGNGTVNTAGYASAVAVDADGNVVVTGSSDNATNSDYYTAKYAAAGGTLLWEQRYNGPANRADKATALALDGSGNVVVSGYSDNATNSDYYTAKYAAADGTLLWEHRYNGPANLDDRAEAVVVDGRGDVVVTGNSWNATNVGSYTAKYAAADGALLWEKLRPGIGTQVTMDSSGNVLVTGYNWNNAHPDFYTAKYAAADGALLWEHSYNGRANLEDIAAAVAVDASNNVVVTGYSATSGSDSNGFINDYYTAKYAAVDGVLLWEKGYNGPANRDDEATAVAVDSNGNVVVTGYSSNLSNTGYYTAKYAAADGALLWEKRYNGTANSYDLAYAVAVDDGGNVVVTGNSATIKYAASDGALLWIKAGSSSLAVGRNGMVATTGLDYTTVVYREVLSPLAAAILSSHVRLRFAGLPGRSYKFERAATIIGPWNTLATPTAPSSGLLEYLDTSPPAGSAFYRMREP